MPSKCLFFAVVFCCALALDPDIYLDMVDMVKSHGYLCETHIITTEDGYKLTIHRIPSRATDQPSSKRQPVYMQPGIFCTSEVFVAGGPKKGAAYFLVDHGYDVWVANSRGTRYSLDHTTYSTKDKRYWNFTFEEQGVYDQRAIIDYIMEKTQFRKVHFWSHSMGGTQMFAALTLEPEYYKKHLLSAVMTGPVIRFDLTTSTFIKIVNYTKLPHLSMTLGAYEFLPYSRVLSLSLVYLKAMLPPIFELFVKIIADETGTVTDFYKSDVFFSHFPAGSSSKCFKHLVQLSEVTGFYRYRETSADPLVPYDLSNIPDDVPLAVFTGQVDMLSTPAESTWLQEELLKLGKKVYIKIFKDMGHIPFLAPLDENVGFLQEGLDFFIGAEMDYYQ